MEPLQGPLLPVPLDRDYHFPREALQNHKWGNLDASKRKQGQQKNHVKPSAFDSIHSKPVVSKDEVVPSVPRRNGEERPMIETSPLHLEYTTSMRSVALNR